MNASTDRSFVTDHLPSQEALTQAGLNESSVFIFAGQLEAIGAKDPGQIARALRRIVYREGLAKGYDEIQSDSVGQAIWDQHVVEGWEHPMERENQEEWESRVRKWRTYFALKALVSLEKSKTDLVLGDINARFRSGPNPGRIAQLCFDAQGHPSNKIRIDRNSPLDLLLDVIDFTDNGKHEAFEHDFSFDAETMIELRGIAHEALINRLISSNPRFIEDAMKFLTYKDYEEVLRAFSVGLDEGHAGRKAANQIVLDPVLRTKTPEFDQAFVDRLGIKNFSVQKLYALLQDVLKPNERRLIGSDLLLQLLHSNPSLGDLSRRKYRPKQSSEVEAVEFKFLREKMNAAQFPKHIERQLKDLWLDIRKTWGDRPFIVRSSSELEDQHGASFAGMYDSDVCLPDDFEGFVRSIKKVYGSVFSPKVMKYREEHGLLCADEQMGLLVQPMYGRWYGDYFIPDFSGVALSDAPQSHGPDPEKGSMTIATGLGEMVVTFGGRIVLFDEPSKNPVKKDDKHGTHAQQEIYVVHRTRGVEKISMEQFLQESRFMGSRETGSPKDIFSKREGGGEVASFVLTTEQDVWATFDPMMKFKKQAPFPLIIRYFVEKLKHCLGWEDVDVEFIGEKSKGQGGGAEGSYSVRIVQARPQNVAPNLKPAEMPKEVPAEDVLFKTKNSLSSGHIEDVSYALYIDPDVYGEEDESTASGKLDADQLQELRSWIAKINTAIHEQGEKAKYIVLTPGRWGDNQGSKVGIPVLSQDYGSACAIIEMVGTGHWKNVPPSAGTHDFQLIREKGILTAAAHLGSEPDSVNRDRFNDAPSCLEELLADAGLLSEGAIIPEHIKRWLRVIKADDLGEKGQSWGFNMAMNNRTKKGAGRSAGLYLAPKGTLAPVLL